MYSGNTAAFMPNEPPTWPVSTWTFSAVDAEHLGEMGAHPEDALRRHVKCKAAAIV